MAHPRRRLAVLTLVSGALLIAPGIARADCSNPLDPDFGDCSPGPSGTPRHTPAPTPKPSAAATPSASAPAQTATPTRRPVTQTRSSTPVPSVASDIEVPTSEPFATPEIIVEGPVPDEQPLDVAAPTASASSWIFGFIVGLLIGGFAGRASWGLRRKRRQQIFG